tara:strand:+ start:222 stop:455 length:234 start_codon:yes stop_codon:yes gene_type:complete
MLKVFEKYNHIDEKIIPKKYIINTNLDPNLSVNIPEGNPPSPRKRTCTVANFPKEIREIENSFSNKIRIAGKIIVIE